MMWKVILIALSLTVSTAHAQSGLTQLQISVARELPKFGYRNVDVTTLSTGKIAHIHYLLFSNNSVAHIRGSIGAVLGRSVIGNLRRRG